MMNERIRELAEQASKEVFPINSIAFMEKFAELIVRECMKLNRDILCEDDPDYLDKVYKEHFGVEE
jgi:hypothetical protein